MYVYAWSIASDFKIGKPLEFVTSKIRGLFSGKINRYSRWMGSNHGTVLRKGMLRRSQNLRHGIFKSINNLIYKNILV